MIQKKKKSLSGAKKSPSLTYQPKPGEHWVLANKKTRKVSSSNNWLVALAAVAVANQDNVGLASLLPQKKAKKLLTTNELSLRIQRGTVSPLINTQIRKEAKSFIPELAALWGEENPELRSPRRKDFCHWVVKCLLDKNSVAYKTAVDHDYYDILDKTNWRWWLARLEKMQS